MPGRPKLRTRFKKQFAHVGFSVELPSMRKKALFFAPLALVVLAGPDDAFAQFPRNTNESRRLRSVLAGGSGNWISPEVFAAVLAGGYSNKVTGNEYAVVSGGADNTASGRSSAVGGGAGNTASGLGSKVGGGFYNQATNNSATVAGGETNRAFAQYGAIGGGRDNEVGPGSGFGFIGGGYNNTTAENYGVVGGGSNNSATGFAATVAGGRSNSASLGGAMVGGGVGNSAAGGVATVAGGAGNTASSFAATVGGGETNTASGLYATVPGGAHNSASHDGSFVWGDGTSATASHGANTFTVRATGGVRFYTAAGTATGPRVAGGGTDFISASDSNLKTKVTAVDPREILAKLSRLPVTEWEYKHNPNRRYIGPMAQDFHAVFALGEDDKGIGTLDSDGVMYAAIQGLVEELKDRDKAMEELKSELRAVKQRLESLPPTP
jgi:hypothetical protein